MFGFRRSSMGIWYAVNLSLFFLLFAVTHTLDFLGAPTLSDFIAGRVWELIGCATTQQTAVFKNQIDWIPLTTGSVRPTQGRTLAIGQVSGGSQSFNSVNSLRILGRWMRMFTIPNQSSIPMAYTQFSDEGQLDDQRLMPSGNRDRLVDCLEEFVKYTILMRPHIELFSDRFSERTERQRRDAKVREAEALQLRDAQERERSTDGKTEIQKEDGTKRGISMTDI